MDPLESIHNSSPKHEFSLQTIWLFIPAIIFVIVLLFFVRGLPRRNAAMDSSPQNISEQIAIKVKDTEVKVTIADSDLKRQKGLGGVAKLESTQGMLFVFPYKSVLTFWMKDTLIPLDMIWITDGKIANITKNVPIEAPGTPDSQLPVYSSAVAVDYVLEVNAGFSDTNNLQIGDSVDLSAVPKQ